MANTEDREPVTPSTEEADEDEQGKAASDEADSSQDQIVEAARALGAEDTSDLSAPLADISVAGATGGTAISGD